MNDAARPSRPPPRPEHYVLGVGGPVAIVPGRVSAWLEDRAGLREARVRHRGIDAEVDACLVAVAVAATAWRSSACGTGTRNQAEPEAQSGPMTTREAADELGCTARGVRKAIGERRLPARLVGGRWLVDREDLAHYRATRAA